MEGNVTDLFLDRPVEWYAATHGKRKLLAERDRRIGTGELRLLVPQERVAAIAAEVGCDAQALHEALDRFAVNLKDFL